MKRWVVAALAVTGLLVATGCSKPERVAYRPISYGADNQCWYVDDPEEVRHLVQDGLCHANWAATPMPDHWRMRYWNYYSSPSYYDVYVPPGRRLTYAASQRSWGEARRTDIETASRQATYLGSNGKAVTAEKIGVAKYGGGNRFGPVGTKFGGGARTPTPNPATPSGASPASPVTPSPKPPPVATPSSPKPLDRSPIEGVPSSPSYDSPSKPPSSPSYQSPYNPPSRSPSMNSPSRPPSSPSKSYGGGGRTSGGGGRRR
ncbi:MAG: hypothetical protein ACRDYF_14585 [Acidimicrobiia bacterium]